MENYTKVIYLRQSAYVLIAFTEKKCKLADEHCAHNICYTVHWGWPQVTIDRDKITQVVLLSEKLYFITIRLDTANGRQDSKFSIELD